MDVLRPILQAIHLGVANTWQRISCSRPDFSFCDHGPGGSTSPTVRGEMQETNRGVSAQALCCCFWFRAHMCRLTVDEKWRRDVQNQRLPSICEQAASRRSQFETQRMERECVCVCGGGCLLMREGHGYRWEFWPLVSDLSPYFQCGPWVHRGYAGLFC